MRGTLLLLSIVAAPIIASGAESTECARCGCASNCRRTCRVICEMKEVKEVCYCCKCEEFCVPGRSQLCGKVCHCDQCKRASGCRWFDFLLGQNHCSTCRNIWKPSCEVELRSRNKLYKKETVKLVPTYKWVVEYRCADCSVVADASAIDSPASSPMEANGSGN